MGTSQNRGLRILAGLAAGIPPTRLPNAVELDEVRNHTKNPDFGGFNFAM